MTRSERRKRRRLSSIQTRERESQDREEETLSKKSLFFPNTISNNDNYNYVSQKLSLSPESVSCCCFACGSEVRSKDDKENNRLRRAIDDSRFLASIVTVGVVDSISSCVGGGRGCFGS